MAWSAEENKSLLEFVLQRGDTHVWPNHPRTSPFWEDAASFVQQISNSTTIRTGIATEIAIHTLVAIAIIFVLATAAQKNVNLVCSLYV